MSIGQLTGPSGRPFLAKATRIAVLCLGIGALTAAYVPLAANLTAIPLLNTECAQVGDISLGPNGNWAHCRVTKSRWFSRIGFIDLYQSQYCLGNHSDQCDRTALLVFANYRLTPIGRLLVERIDPAGTEYDDPLVAATDQGRVLILSSRTPDAPAEVPSTKSYFRWTSGDWHRINEATGGSTSEPQPQSRGTAIATRVTPDIEKTYSWSSSMPGWRSRLFPD